MKSNSRNNFCLCFKKMLIEEKKTLLLNLSVCTGLCVVFGLLVGFAGGIPNEETTVFYVMGAGLACAIAASTIFRNVQTRQDKISTLMTPASAAEKFWPHYLTAVPGMLIVAVAGYFIFSYCIVLGHGITFDMWTTMFMPDFNRHSAGYEILLVICTIYLFNEGVFVLGAAIWPKKAFLKTTLAMVAIWFVFTTSLIFLARFIPSSHATYIISDEALTWGLFVSSLLFNVGATWGGYLVFKKTTLKRA